MTKIKNFRITLRGREAVRWLKANRGMAVTPDLEAAVDHAIVGAKDLVETAALYTTLTRATAEKLVTLELPKAAVAVSVVAVTVGDKLEAASQAAEQAGEVLQASLLSALGQEALQQAVHFATRLIQEQAKDEDCEMAVPVVVKEGPLVAPFSELLGVQRVGIHLTDTGLPANARMAWTFWTPVRKAAKREAPAKGEKVAA